MRYSGELVLDPYYRFEKSLEGLIKYKESLDRDEQRHARERRKMREFEEKIGISPQEPSPFDDFLGVVAEVCFLFPSYVLSLSSAKDSDLLSRFFGERLTFSFTIDSTPGEEAFEFAAGQGDDRFCWYRREPGGITISESPEKIFEFLGIPNAGDCGGLFDPDLDPIETARRFSLHIGIPLLWGGEKNDILLLSEMTREEEASSRYAGKLDFRRPDLGGPEESQGAGKLSDCRLLLWSRYLAVYTPLDGILARFPYQVPLEEGPRPPVPVTRIDPYAKTTCIHLFREDLPENALEDLIGWCESHSEDYQILVEDRFFGVWCEEWRGDDDYTAYFQLRDQFNCRMLGVWMHDDLFFSLNLWKSGQVAAGLSFSCEESPGVTAPGLARREFGLELEPLEDYQDAEAFAARVGFFVVPPETIPGAKKLQESERGLVYAFPG